MARRDAYGLCLLDKVNQLWSLDFASDVFTDGRRFRWKEKKFWGAENYFIDVETIGSLRGLRRDGSIVQFSHVNKSSNLSQIFEDTFPQNVQYFD